MRVQGGMASAMKCEEGDQCRSEQVCTYAP